MKKISLFLAVILTMAILAPSCGDTELIMMSDTIQSNMVLVEGGTFMMGSDSSYYEEDGPVHEVTVKSFMICKYQVTQRQWQLVMGKNPSEFQDGSDQRPVENISWDDAQEFITKLNEATGRHFRMPTEAEWEYAARGGKKSQGFIYAGSNDNHEVGRCYAEYDNGTAPVGSYKPNELGLHDMTGNVLEFCSDRYAEYTSDAQKDPQGPAEGWSRVIRGGAWFSASRNCTVYHHRGVNPTERANGLGLRLAIDPQ